MDRQGYIEEYGSYFESQGLPLSAGRVIGLMMVTKDPLNLDDMVEQLSISKTSASTATRLLESSAIIRRIAVRGDRRIHYAIAGDMWPELFRQKIQTFTYLADLAQRGLAVVDAAEEEVGERLKNMEQFYRFLADEMDQAVDRWQERKEKEK